MAYHKYFKTGVKDAIPLYISYTFMCGSVGALCHGHGISILNTILLSLLVFAVPLQLAIVYAIKHHPGVLYFATLAFLVNSRFILNATAISGFWRKYKLYQLLPAILLFSASAFMVTYTHYKSTNIKRGHLTYYYGVALPSYLVSLCAAILGYYFIDTSNNMLLKAIFAIVLPLHFSSLTARRLPQIVPIIATGLGLIFTPFINIIPDRFAGIAFDCIVGLILALIVSLYKSNSQKIS